MRDYVPMYRVMYTQCKCARKKIENVEKSYCLDLQSIAASQFNVSGQQQASAGVTVVTGTTAAMAVASASSKVSATAATPVTGIRVLTPSMVAPSAIRVTPAVARQTGMH